MRHYYIKFSKNISIVALDFLQRLMNLILSNINFGLRLLRHVINVKSG